MCGALQRTLTPAWVAAALVLAAGEVRAQTMMADGDSLYRLYMNFPALIRGGTVEPHWLRDGRSFWYIDSTSRVGAPRVFMVDPIRNTHVEIEDSLTRIEVFRSQRAIRPPSGNIVAGAGYRDRAAVEVPSPDGRWIATITDNDVWLRSAADGSLRRLTHDGTRTDEWVNDGFPCSAMIWSPDSRYLAGVRLDSRRVPERPLVHWLAQPETVEFKPFVNDPVPSPTLYAWDVRDGRSVRIASSDSTVNYLMPLSWTTGNKLLYLQADSGLRTVALMAGNIGGSSREVVRESQPFPYPRGVLGPRFYDDCAAMYSPTAGGSLFLWLSERSGSRQLYLYKMDGALVRRLTDGTSPLVRLVAVDSTRGWIYYLAHGNRTRPYDTQLYRVSMGGGRPALLTPGTGQHEPRFSPSLDFFLDSHSAIDREPRTDLRRADGTLVRTVARADITHLLATGWRPPESFTATAADGITELWGVLYRPNSFDPLKKYPVLEIIYGGALFSEVQHAFVGRHFAMADFHGEHAQALAQLGFVVFMVDARGSAERDRVFQDAGAGLDRASVVIADHHAVLRQLGRRFPFMDLERVGLFGHSAGGFYTVRAMLTYPDVYKVGAAVSGGALLWGEGGTNLPLADRLRGKLLIVHGTSDVYVPFSDAMRLADAFAQAGKRFDLIVLPEQPHFLRGHGLQYTREAIRRLFAEQLRP